MLCKIFSNKACNIFKTIIHLVAGFLISLPRKKSHQVTFANPFLSAPNVPQDSECICRIQGRQWHPSWLMLPIELYTDSSFTVKAINRTQKIALNSVTDMHSSYEMPQGHGCRLFQDLSWNLSQFLKGSAAAKNQAHNNLTFTENAVLSTGQNSLVPYSCA